MRIGARSSKQNILFSYRPVSCQSEPSFADRPARVQGLEIQRQRRKRWAERERSDLWAAHPDRMEEE